MEKEINKIKFQNEEKNKPRYTEQTINNKIFISRSQDNIIGYNKKINVDLQSNFIHNDNKDSDNL